MAGLVDGCRARDVIDLNFSRAAQGSGPVPLPIGVVVAAPWAAQPDLTAHLALSTDCLSAFQSQNYKIEFDALLTSRAYSNSSIVVWVCIYFQISFIYSKFVFISAI